MKHVFSNATVLCGNDFEVTKGYIVVEEGIIKEIGEGSYLYSSTDVKRGIISPSFTNAHIHLGDSIAQDKGAYKNIDDRVGPGGIKFKVLEYNISGGLRHSIKEMTGSGTGAFCDFREGGLKGIEKLKAELDGFLEAVILGRPDTTPIEDVIKGCDGIGIGSTEDSPEKLESISRAVKKSGKLLGIHAGEAKDDVKHALALNPDFLVHLTNAGDESLERIFKLKIPVVLCPRANAMLGVGIPKIKKIMENTLTALGTDNVMINSTNMLREVEFAFKAARGMEKNYKFSGREILRAATFNGRKILGLQSNSIEEGNKASFIVFTRRKYLYDPVVAIIHRYESVDIRGIMGDQFIKCTKRY